MRLRDDEVQEWHDHLYEQRNAYRKLLFDIVSGIPTIPGMASTYRPLTLKEIQKRAKDLLNEQIH